jgi:hypothetical protein
MVCVPPVSQIGSNRRCHDQGILNRSGSSAMLAQAVIFAEVVTVTTCSSLEATNTSGCYSLSVNPEGQLQYNLLVV